MLRRNFTMDNLHSSQSHPAMDTRHLTDSEEQCFMIGVYDAMTCACAMVAYLGLTLPLLDAVPRTIQFERVDWDSGRPTQTHSVSGEIASSLDGSRTNRLQYVSRRFHLFTTGKQFVHSIYDRNSHTSYLIDDEKRTVLVFPCTCEWQRTAWPEDFQCSSAAKEYDAKLIYMEWDSRCRHSCDSVQPSKYIANNRTQRSRSCLQEPHRNVPPMGP